ncbi:MAG TPA: dihydrofolate reductase family protein [Dermatophilaceae bacterium]|nr:dihydrofolate reductase family protein [Dermatophilaceae bacterium]
MGRLRYTAICSLDGYVNDEHGEFGWAEPDEQVHRFVNERERAVGTYLYGRRLYGVMSAWADEGWLAGEQDFVQEYGRIWAAADKVVYSTTMSEVSTPRTRLEASFDPDAVAALKGSSERDISVGGPALAVHAFAAGLVDQVGLFLHPVVVGGGSRALPDGVRLHLDLVEERRFDSGVVFLGYRVTS